MDKLNMLVSSLLNLANRQGYLLFDDILDVSDENGLSVSEVDQVSELIKLKGIILYEERPSETPKQEYSDYSQIDYEDVYNEAYSISPNLKHLIDVIKSIVPPQYGEIITLTEQVWNGNEYARERLINCQLRVALKLALNISKANNYDLEDAISAAFMGLVIAADRFDPNGFSTFQAYASWWIQTTISRECKPLWMEYYYPVHYKEKMLPIYGEYCELSELSAYDDDDEILNIISKKKNLPVETVLQYIEAARNQRTGKLSYESLIEDETSILYSDPFTYSETNNINKSQLQDAIRNELMVFKPREREIIEARYGLIDGAGKTLEEVGKLFGVTRERIRQIENKVMRRLSSKQVRERLHDHYYHR